MKEMENLQSNALEEWMRLESNIDQRLHIYMEATQELIPLPKTYEISFKFINIHNA